MSAPDLNKRVCIVVVAFNAFHKDAQEVYPLHLYIDPRYSVCIWCMTVEM